MSPAWSLRLLIPVSTVWMFMVAACSVTRSAVEEETTTRQDSLEIVAEFSDPNLHSTLWMQTSVEYVGAARQAYRLAGLMLERALADSSWTAALEQAEMGSAAYRELPPAVVLDVDETVLDNTAYQARLIRDGAVYDSESWNAWVRERKATPVPGAVDFTQAAHAMGVQVFYVTNRDHTVEDATRDNLRLFGFPVAPDTDLILTKGERPAWDGSKTPRRRYLAERYRILLLVGDNLGDFAPGAESRREARERVGRRYARFWGTRWIVIPNPQYGSWEAALYDFDYALPYLEKLERKYRHLDTARDEEANE